MYNDVKELIMASNELKSLSTNINIPRAQKELGTKDIQNPIDISRAIRKTRSDPRLYQHLIPNVMLKSLFYQATQIMVKTKPFLVFYMQ